MDADTGTCSSETYHYSGSLSPLDEEVSYICMNTGIRRLIARLIAVFAYQGSHALEASSLLYF